jgi:peptide/nickel transport system permease protein
MNVANKYYTIKQMLSCNRAFKRACQVFGVFVIVVILAPFIANDKPLVCNYQGQWLFPAFSWKQQVILPNQEIMHYNMGREWKLKNYDFAIFAPCAYSPNTIDADNAPRKSPFDKQLLESSNKKLVPLPLKYRHWLGTTQNGTDVLSGIIHGTKIALSVGIFSMLIAALFGIGLGASAGYFGNNALKIGYVQIILLIISLGIAWFYGFVVRTSSLSNAFQQGGIYLIMQLFLSFCICGIIIYLFSFIGKRIDTNLKLSKNLHLPVDAIVSRLIEILNAIPSLLLIITLSAIAKPSYTVLICIIGFLSWTNIARLTRTEFQKTKQLDYITSCKAIGMSDFRVMYKHILPNVFSLILVQLVFGMAGAVLVEASLSFIGVGVPLDIVTWGSLLNEARDHFSSWWLVLFPGLCVFTLIYIYNKIGKELSIFCTIT